MAKLNTYMSGPDDKGHFGPYGGRFVAETLMPLILQLEQELPYAVFVETEAWEEEEASVKVAQVITVQREGQKPIVLGKGGQTIKKIGELARTEMEEIFDRRVHLFLFVKVRENWGEDPERYREQGLNFPKD